MSPRPVRRGEALGPVLRAIREERGETRERLAVRAGLSVGTLARLELAESDPGWSTIVAIADALGLTLAGLGKLMDDARRAQATRRAQPQTSSDTHAQA
jgi:transcriptional regulator with XRE-family HTH domain